MESEANGSRQQALCIKGCGFYGSPSFNGMCSKCHKQVVRREDEQRQLAAEGRLASLGDRSSTATCRDTSTVAEGHRKVELLTPSAESETSVTDTRTVESSEAAKSSVESCIESARSPEEAPKKTKRARCYVESCRARLGLTGFDCRCGHKFCSKHRYADEHNCDFDYKTDGRAALEKINQACRAPRVEKL